MTRFEEIPRVHIIRKEDKNEIKNNKETSYGRCFTALAVVGSMLSVPVASDRKSVV